MYTNEAPRTADRSLPRKSLVMVVHPEEIAALPEPALPEGYRIRLYESGDAEHWARLMTDVREFETQNAGLESFNRQFMPEEAELRRRLGFIVAPDGAPVATSMAWWFEEGGRRYGRLHWVCVHPDHQNFGLGRAVVAWGMRRTAALEPGLDVYLDTQTWSHKAIGLYLRLGFHPVRESHPVLHDMNEYGETLEILRGVLPPQTLRLFLERSVD